MSMAPRDDYKLAMAVAEREAFFAELVTLRKRLYPVNHAFEAMRLNFKDAVKMFYESVKQRDEVRKRLGEAEAREDQYKDMTLKLEDRVKAMERVVEAAKDVLAVRGKDFERNPLPAYMERPFSVLAGELKSFASLAPKESSTTKGGEVA